MKRAVAFKVMDGAIKTHELMKLALKCIKIRACKHIYFCWLTINSESSAQITIRKTGRAMLVSLLY